MDATTLAQLSLVTSLTATLGAGFLWFRHPGEPGTAQWTLHYAFLAVSMLLLGLRGKAADWLTVIVANILLSLAFVFFHDGMRRFLGAPKLNLGAYGVVGVGTAIFFALVPLPVRGGYQMILEMVFYGATALVMWRGTTPRMLTIRTLAAVVLLHSLYCAVVGVWTPFALEPGQEFFANSRVVTAQLLEGIVIVFISVIGLGQMLAERYATHWQAMASLDSLTTTLNRRGFEEAAKRMLRKHPGPVSLAIADIDHFKAINDAYGHEVGDEVLVHVTETLRRELRSSDLLGRIGGEEFAFVMPVPLEDATGILERVRTRVKETPHPQTGATLTLSIGCVERVRIEDDLATLLRDADAAMYRAKQAGRDRVEMTPRAGMNRRALPERLRTSPDS